MKEAGIETKLESGTETVIGIETESESVAEAGVEAPCGEDAEVEAGAAVTVPAEVEVEAQVLSDGVTRKMMIMIENILTGRKAEGIKKIVGTRRKVLKLKILLGLK